MDLRSKRREATNRFCVICFDRIYKKFETDEDGFEKCVWAEYRTCCESHKNYANSLATLDIERKSPQIDLENDIDTLLF